MATKRIIAICMSGGEFETDKDNGSLSYSGGDASAVDLDENTKLIDLKKELAETFSCSVKGMVIKYFLPGKSNKRTLITISKDKDIQRLVSFFEDKDQVEVFLIAQQAVQVQNVLNVPDRRLSRTTMSEEVVLSPAPINVFHTDNLIDMGTPNKTTPGGVLCISNDEHRKPAMEWENAITGVGQRFGCFTEFLEALRKYSMAHGFSYLYRRKDHNRVTVTCKSEGCPWRVNVSRLTTDQFIYIKRMSTSHECEGPSTKANYRVTKEWVEGVIKEKMKIFPNYKPKDIAKDIEQEYGIQLSVGRARRAKESARQQLQGSYAEAYNQLPFFCEKIMETNPGSLATFITNEDSSFRGLFISFHALISGFQQGCRPLFFLNSSPINSKYQGMLLAATAMDGDDGIFPVAFAMVDLETDDNWRWFLSELKSAVSTFQQITFVADFQKGLRELLHDIFGEDCYHCYCLHYVAEKFNKDLKVQLAYDARQLLVQDLYAAAKVTKLEDFERITQNMKSISPDAYNWIVQSEPDHWANALVGGARYNHMTSDFGLPFYSWVSELNDFPIIQMVNVLRGKMMELIYKRRVDSTQWLTRLTPSMEEKLQKETSKASSLQVLPSHDNIYQVRGESVNMVDIDHWDCSCKVWQLTGLPCCHAIAVFECLGMSPYNYCSRYLTVDSYRLAYGESINPVPDVDRSLNIDGPAQSELIPEGIIVTPPLTKRSRGRGQKKMKHPGLLVIVRRELKCSKCKAIGHTKRSCK